MKIKKSFLLLGLIFMLLACDQSLNISNRSGSIDDDYIAEPLSEISVKYENALKISNAVIEKLKVREYDSIYDNDFDRQLKNMISKEQFRSLMKQVEAMFGSVKRYKKMQKVKFSLFLRFNFSCQT